MVMGLPVKSRSLVAAAATVLSVALLLPAQAQFWEPWGGRQQQQQRQQPSYNPFGGGFWAPQGPQRDREREMQRDAPIDYSRAPAPAQKKPEATTNIVVMGDAMADWLALGLEEAFSEKPEIGVVRKHRTEAGLIRYDQRRDIEWPQIAREIIAAEKPKYIVMMVGNNDRQSIREKAPVARPVAPAAPKAPQAPTAQQAQSGAPAPQAAPPPAPPPPDPEQQALEPQENPEPPPTPEQIRAGALGPWDFHTEKWEAAYIRRVDAAMAALKTAGVPVIWVGLPPQRATKVSSDSAYLNEIYRSRAEKAGITYVDVWDGFVDESGRFAQQGPDYEGQTRRLRSGDGIYFTKFGARKLAHYVEREIQRHITNRAVPVALPIPVEPGTPGAAKPGGPAQRPAVGPVIPLTASAAPPVEELMGGGRAPARQTTPDPVASRVLTKGEPITAPIGRADDFAWPRGSAPIAEPVALQPTPPSPPTPSASTPSAQSKAGQPGAAAQRGTTDAQAAGDPKQAQKQRPRQDAPRPPLSIFQGLFR
jgi:uncharacterized protein